MRQREEIHHHFIAFSLDTLGQRATRVREVVDRSQIDAHVKAIRNQLPQHIEVAVARHKNDVLTERVGSRAIVQHANHRVPRITGVLFPAGIS